LRLLEEITEVIEQCCGSLQSWKKVKQVPGSSRESVDGSENLDEWRVLVGSGARHYLGCIYSGR